MISFIFSLLCFSVNADQIKLLDNDNLAIEMRMNIVTNAKKEIFIESYDFGHDQYTYNLLRTLKLKAKEGVKVKIIIDAANNILTPYEIHSLSKDTNQNLEVKIFNKKLNLFHPIHKLYRNHEKLLSVDGGTDTPMMILGGRNNTEEYFGKSKNLNFLDLDIFIIGHSAKVAHDYFLKLWSKNPELSHTNFSTKELNYKKNTIYYDFSNLKELNYSNYPIYKIFDNLEEVGPILFSFNDPTLKMNHIKNKIVHKLINGILEYTKESLTLFTPYLYPTKEEYDMLKKLSEKHVKIKIITNSLKSNDLIMAHAFFLAIKKKLTKLGIELYVYNGPKTLHTKAAIIDDTYFLIGSFNLNYRSAKMNREIGVAFGNFDQEGQFFKQLSFFLNDKVLKNSTLAAKNFKEKSLNSLDQDNPKKKRVKIKVYEGFAKVVKALGF